MMGWTSEAECSNWHHHYDKICKGQRSNIPFFYIFVIFLYMFRLLLQQTLNEWKCTVSAILLKNSPNFNCFVQLTVQLVTGWWYNQHNEVTMMRFREFTWSQRNRSKKADFLPKHLENYKASKRSLFAELSSLKKKKNYHTWNYIPAIDKLA